MIVESTKVHPVRSMIGFARPDAGKSLEYETSRRSYPSRATTRDHRASAHGGRGVAPAVRQVAGALHGAQCPRPAPTRRPGSPRCTVHSAQALNSGQSPSVLSVCRASCAGHADCRYSCSSSRPSIARSNSQLDGLDGRRTDQTISSTELWAERPCLPEVLSRSQSGSAWTRTTCWAARSSRSSVARSSRRPESGRRQRGS